MLNTIMRNCPAGLPFALKINAVTPMSDAVSVSMLFAPKIKKDTTISVTDAAHSAASPFEKEGYIDLNFSYMTTS